MPPKLTLKLDTASLRNDVLNDPGQRSIADVPDKPAHEPSLDQNTINIDKDGNLQLIKSFQAIEFNNSGVNINQRNAITSPLATGLRCTTQCVGELTSALPVRLGQW